ncbi:hypothetical protein LCGC14_0858050 [marine sediment metagenome]|uniref:Uncharacterized protein n=1 Tax=marine sediment metagenome TaxID=412755 RepID=A0A0F9P855_9ZZZZ|nr:MAG: hypothetical protein Lokiarch_19370 [Candidatus Lokiarchaeum sp. GC14_75]HEC40531.1 hypothetical protein [bacterium]
MKDDTQEGPPFPIRVDPHDMMILGKLEKNTHIELLNYDEHLWYLEQWSLQDVDDEKNQELEFVDPFGVLYKTDKEGKVILVWYALSAHGGTPIAILRKVPDELLELSHLKYLYLFCDVNAIETLPSTIKSNDIFEVIIQPIGPESTNLAPNRSEAYHRCQRYNINEGTGYEIIIVRKDLISEINSQPPDDYYGPAIFLKNEMFKRFWKSENQE